MKFLVSVFVGLGLIVSVAQAAPKRKVAQENMACVPLGVPFNPYDSDGKLTRSAFQLKMLRNSIFAQLGFEFEDEAVATEMAKTGCLKTDVKFSPDKLTDIDKKNIHLLKALEQAAHNEEFTNEFQNEWTATANDPAKRADLLSYQYCNLMAGDQFLGILSFGQQKVGDQFSLQGMTNVKNPTFTKYAAQKRRASYTKKIANQTIDTTSAGTYLDFQTKGSWIVGSTKDDMGQLKITMKTEQADLKDAFVTITSKKFSTIGMLECSVATK